jgi:hypothetical protein
MINTCVAENVFPELNGLLLVETPDVYIVYACAAKITDSSKVRFKILARTIPSLIMLINGSPCMRGMTEC